MQKKKILQEKEVNIEDHKCRYWQLKVLIPIKVKENTKLKWIKRMKNRKIYIIDNHLLNKIHFQTQTVLLKKILIVDYLDLWVENMIRK